MTSRIEKFLALYNSKKTVSTYKWILSTFFESVYGEDEGKLEQHGEKYFMQARDYKEDIQKYFSTIKDKPPKSVRSMLACVRTFLVENDVELPAKFWRRLTRRVKGSRALTLDKVPSNVELRQILMHMPIQGKALYLALASSGMRIGEALQLTLEDMQLDEEPAKVSIRGQYTKTGNARIAFTSGEATEAIREWLKVREQYIESAVGKSHKYGKSVDDARLFPFRDSTAYAIWKNALAKTGLLKKDKTTNRHTIHPHVLRKFFRTKLGAVIPVDVVEALMGHEGYLTEVYRRYSMEQLAQFYKRGESTLLIFTEAEEVGRLRQEVEERNKQLQTLVNGLATENVELKQRLSTVEKDVAGRDKELQTLKRQYTDLRTHFEKITEIKIKYLQEAYQKSVLEELEESEQEDRQYEE